MGDNYGGIQYSQVNVDIDGLDDADPTALVGKLGQFVTENVAIEGRLGFGVSDDEIDVDLGPFFGEVEVEVEVNYLAGVYAVVHSDTEATATFYGLVGITQGEIELSVGGESVDDDDSGLSYGLGVNIKNFNLEYMSYLEEDDYDVTAISIGYVSEF